VINIDDHSALLREQVAYYQDRAHEYDEWFFRQGRYDRGPELNQQWFREVEEVRRQLSAFKPEGSVLELACGTGIWTEQLLRHATHITAVDAASEMLAIHRARMQSSAIQYVQADIFDWIPTEQYDAVFFGFWLSHIPPERLESFWSLVGTAVKPQGRVFFVDSQYEPMSTAKDHHLEGEQATTVTRRLNDGREFRIVKVFYKPGPFAEQLRKFGWTLTIQETAHYFIYGYGGKSRR
jgi:demethylmenaquinone methyltransferase/2-methoxy-6-polyprenyl-1,4-benzoquinol methylase